MVRLSQLAAGLLLAAGSALGLPTEDGLEKRSTDKLVFAHFIVGIVSDRKSAADYDADMKRAKAVGIDAFALNVGTNDFTDAQLDYAYESAANNGMHVFISFDFNYYTSSSGSEVGSTIARYAGKAGQLMVDKKVFVSTFTGDGVDVGAIRNAAGVDIFFAPNFHPYANDFGNIDAALNWMGWPNNGNNRAPSPGANVTVPDGDNQYVSALAGKPYIAPVSPWFSTHYGAEVSYSKNWVFPCDLLWYNRWNEVLSLGPQYLEIVTWNDYGESHYVGPLSSPHYDDGASKWANDMPHDGWLDMAVPFISAFKAGASSANSFVKEDRLVYWYRPTLKDINCDSTDTCMGAADNSSGNYYYGRPNGYETLEDAVFVVALLKEAGSVTVSSGSNTETFNAPAGVSAFQVSMGLGKQQFSLKRGGSTVLSTVSPRDITNVCPCGIYNFNAYVNTVPTDFCDQLQPQGLSSLTVGLHVTTCAAAPTLACTATATTAPIGGGGGRTTTTAPAATTTHSGVCTEGTGKDNYGGLCSFCCHYGYCPSVCTCTAWGAQVAPPPTTGVTGQPADGLGASYSGLCSYACNHGYCPSTACKKV